MVNEDMFKIKSDVLKILPSQWRYYGCNGISNHWCLNCLLNHLFKHRSKGNIKALLHWPLWGNSPVTGEFTAQKAINTENVSIWRCHHDSFFLLTDYYNLWLQLSWTAKPLFSPWNIHFFKFCPLNFVVSCWDEAGFDPLAWWPVTWRNTSQTIGLEQSFLLYSIEANIKLNSSGNSASKIINIL